MGDRDQYLLRSLVTAQRERKMAMKTRDAGLIKSAETRLAVAWKNACDHVDVTTRAALMAGSSREPMQASSSDSCDGMILADGYTNGMTVSDPTGHHEVSLFYKYREQAEAAFDVITTLIDAAIRNEQTKEGEDRA